MSRFAPLLVAICVVFASRAAHARGCTEVSDIVGEEKCTRYGAEWSIEHRFPLNYSFGTRYAEFSPAGATFIEGYKRRPKGWVPHRFDGAALGVSKLRGIGVSGGVTFYVWGQL